MVTLPIKMPKVCKECIVSVLEDDGYFGWRRYCKLLKRYVNELDKEKDCPLTEAKISHWKIEYVKEENRTYALCMNCKTGICFEGKYTNNLPVSAKYCPNCGVEMRCVVRTVEPKESEAANGETVR